MNWKTTGVLLTGAMLGWATLACSDRVSLTKGPDGRDMGPHADGPVCNVVKQVRVLFVLDDSTSMAELDPHHVRRKWVMTAIFDAPEDGSVSFGALRFTERPWAQGPAFHSDKGGALEAVGGPLDSSGGLSDIQGALMWASRLVQVEADQLAANMRAHTRFHVVLVSDGQASPRCTKGCNNDSGDLNTDERPLGLGGATQVSPRVLCDIARDEWSQVFRVQDLSSWFPAMHQPCGSYNSDSDLVEMVEQLRSLAKSHGLHSVHLHTLVPTTQSSPKEGSAPDHPTINTQLLSQLAEAGDGLQLSVGDPPSRLDLSIGHCAAE